jgi:hypothetical protein
MVIVNSLAAPKPAAEAAPKPKFHYSASVTQATFLLYARRTCAALACKCEHGSCLYLPYCSTKAARQISAVLILFSSDEWVTMQHTHCYKTIKQGRCFIYWTFGTLLQRTSKWTRIIKHQYVLCLSTTGTGPVGKR